MPVGRRPRLELCPRLLEVGAEEFLQFSRRDGRVGKLGGQIVKSRRDDICRKRRVVTAAAAAEEETHQSKGFTDQVLPSASCQQSTCHRQTAWLPVPAARWAQYRIFHWNKHDKPFIFQILTPAGKQ